METPRGSAVPAVPLSLGPFRAKVRPHGPLCVEQMKRKGGKKKAGKEEGVALSHGVMLLR